MGVQRQIGDSRANRVQKFRPDGSYFTQPGIDGEADGEFDFPAGIVAVATSGNDRGQIFRPLPVE